MRMANEQQIDTQATFRCFACEESRPVSNQVECCGCSQDICAGCSEKRRCACDLLKMLPVTSLVN